MQCTSKLLNRALPNVKKLLQRPRFILPEEVHYWIGLKRDALKIGDHVGFCLIVL